LRSGAGAGAPRSQVPDRRHDNNRGHPDISVADRQQEARRIRTLGGEVVREAPDYTVTRDPEGNQFCIVER
jgi:predicted enzyme related to lactoylglutathione lyase